MDVITYNYFKIIMMFLQLIVKYPNYVNVLSQWLQSLGNCKDDKLLSKVVW